MSGNSTSAHPKISVVMSVYNGEAHLAETVESILSQAEIDFEFVIVDDGSEDATPEILSLYSARDSRVRVLAREHRGLTHGLIDGCAAARAPLIARQDAGDLSHPERLIKQASLFTQSPDLTFASCWTEFVGPEMEHLYVIRGTGVTVAAPQRVLVPDADPPMLDGPSHHGSVMFRRDAYLAVGGYRAAFRYGQDWDLWYRLAAAGLFQMVNEVEYRARILPESISVEARELQSKVGTVSRRAMLARAQHQSDAPYLKEAEAIGRAVRGRRSRAAGFYFVGEALRRNRDPRSTVYLRRALSAGPFSLRTWLRYLQSLVLRT